MISPYLGHESQLNSIEEVRLVGGKGDGMRLFQVRNAAGLELCVSADRCADISRLLYRGISLGYFSPCGYVAPAYYDGNGLGFLKSFTAGFLTTCGLSAVGSPCTDDGEDLPLHGTIGNTPCDRIFADETGDALVIRARITDARLFSRKLVLSRTVTVFKNEARFLICDEVENCGDAESPLCLLYHMNTGYPLLDENARLSINSVGVAPRNEHAAEDQDTWMKLLPPTPGFEEQCYYHSFGEGLATASLEQPALGIGLDISFDPKELPCFTQWKMMGVRDYVLGLEPGNSTPDGRDVLRRENRLNTILPGEKKTFHIEVRCRDL